MRAQEMRDFQNDEFENDRNYNYRQGKLCNKKSI
jgi:hypothetical protein